MLNSKIPRMLQVTHSTISVLNTFNKRIFMSESEHDTDQKDTIMNLMNLI